MFYSVVMYCLVSLLPASALSWESRGTTRTVVQRVRLTIVLPHGLPELV